MCLCRVITSVVFVCKQDKRVEDFVFLILVRLVVKQYLQHHYNVVSMLITDINCRLPCLPENTLSSMEMAYRHGAHMVETDVAVTQDLVSLCQCVSRVRSRVLI